LTEVQTEGVFPVFCQYYDDHSIGKAVLENMESGSVHDLKVSVFIKRYMDSPKIYEISGELKKREKPEGFNLRHRKRSYCFEICEESRRHGF